MSPNDVYQINFHFYYKNEPKYSYYDRLIKCYMQFGFFQKVKIDLFEYGHRSFSLSKNVLFTSVEEYKKGIIKFDSMSFENYKDLFQVYFLVCISIFGLFVIGELSNRLRRSVSSYAFDQFTYQAKNNILSFKKSVSNLKRRKIKGKTFWSETVIKR